jgi:hypothetical protein
MRIEINEEVELDMDILCDNLHQLSKRELTLLHEATSNEISNSYSDNVTQITDNHILVKLNKSDMTLDNLEKFEYLSKNIWDKQN